MESYVSLMDFLQRNPYAWVSPKRADADREIADQYVKHYGAMTAKQKARFDKWFEPQLAPLFGAQDEVLACIGKNQRRRSRFGGVSPNYQAYMPFVAMQLHTLGEMVTALRGGFLEHFLALEEKRDKRRAQKRAWEARNHNRRKAEKAAWDSANRDKRNTQKAASARNRRARKPVLTVIEGGLAA